MTTITLTDAQVASVLQQQGQPAPIPAPPVTAPIVPVAPVAAAVPVVPGFDGPVAAQSIAWAPGDIRVVSVGFSGATIWHVGFTTGAPSSRPARLQVAEYAPAQPSPRQWVLVRVVDGLVVASGQDSPTITVWMSVVNPMYGPTLQANTAYMLFVKNQNGDGGQMSVDLIL